MINWIATAETVCRAAAGPDLVGVPLYILLASEVPPEFAPVGATGYTAQWLSSALREWLESQGLWRGPGFCCILDESKIGGGVVAFVAATVHELAHFIVAKSVGQMLGARELPLATAALVASCAEPLDLPTPTRWHQHDDLFLRAALHLRRRADIAGYWMGCDDMHLGGDAYGLGDAYGYAKLLADEIEGQISEPITRILQTEPPEEFVMEIQKDQAAYVASTNADGSSPHKCNSCTMLRQLSGRQNYTTTRAGGKIVDCKNCGHSWGVEK